jgi:hypothetical protein
VAYQKWTGPLVIIVNRRENSRNGAAIMCHPSHDHHRLRPAFCESPPEEKISQPLGDRAGQRTDQGEGSLGKRPKGNKVLRSAIPPRMIISIPNCKVVSFSTVSIQAAFEVP